MTNEELLEQFKQIKQEIKSFEERVQVDLRGEITREIRASEERVKVNLREEIKASEERVTSGLRQEFSTEIKASEERIKTELSSEITKEIKASERRQTKKSHKEHNLILKYHDEYAIFLRGRIEKLEEKAGIVHFKH